MENDGPNEEETTVGVDSSPEIQTEGAVNETGDKDVNSNADDDDDDTAPIPVGHCLFCDEKFDNIQEALVHMTEKHGFFVPCMCIYPFIYVSTLLPN